VSADIIGVRFVDPLPPAPPELIPGFLPMSGTTLIAGPTNVGKSLLAIEIASAVTTGQPLWGHLKPVRRLQNVRYLLGEHQTRTIHELYHLTGLPMGKHGRIIGPDCLPKTKAIVGKNGTDADVLDEYRKLLAGAELLIVDPLTAFVSGANVENDNSAMRATVDALNLLGSENGAPVIVLGHFGKPQEGADGEEVHRGSYATRGASSTEDAFENVFYLTEKDDWFELRNRKRKGVQPKPMKLHRDKTTRTHSLLVSSRPTIEIEQGRFNTTMRKVLKVGVSATEAVKVVAAVHNISESTAWRWHRAGKSAA
jgi:RecA-family ATPase